MSDGCASVVTLGFSWCTMWLGLATRAFLQLCYGWAFTLAASPNTKITDLRKYLIITFIYI